MVGSSQDAQDPTPSGASKRRDESKMRAASDRTPLSCSTPAPDAAGQEAGARCAESRLFPSCKVRLGTNGETSRVSTQKFTVSRHENRICKYMEDMYCDNDYINMTPTRCSVLITSESGDELISLRGQFIGRAEQHLPQHYYIPVRTTCTTSEFGW